VPINKIIIIISNNVETINVFSFFLSVQLYIQ